MAKIPRKSGVLPRTATAGTNKRGKHILKIRDQVFTKLKLPKVKAIGKILQGTIATNADSANDNFPI